jgi:hypothetical protein
VELTGLAKALGSGWINVIIFTAFAIVLLALTRGTLGFKAEEK